MAFKALNKINGKLKFIYRKKKFLTPTLRRMLSNAISHILIMPAWYLNLNKKLKKKIQIAQNKCIWFCLKVEHSFYRTVKITIKSFNEIVFKTKHCQIREFCLMMF